jgi:mRNA interferase MazF
MRRGDIWLAELPVGGARPVVLVSREGSYERRRKATVAPITTTIRRIPVEVAVDAANGLEHDSVVNADELQTIPLRDLVERLGAIAAEQLVALDAALHFALGLAP